MILKDVFYAEIELRESVNDDEFINKGWYSLNMHKAYPDEKVGADAFLDWARDLFWIKQKHIIIVIKGMINSRTYETIEFLDKYWEKRLKTAKDPIDRKRVDFIIAGELK